MNEVNTIDTPDRISLLPDSIVHKILSCLLDDPKSRLRMSVLSKGWFTLTTSFPSLYFRQDMGRKFDEEYIRDRFYKYVEYTVSRFSEHNISAHTLYIVAEIRNLEQRQLFGRCLDLVLEKGLQILDIGFNYYPGNLSVGNTELRRPTLSLLRLPNTFLFASSLTSLTLTSCELPSSLTDSVVKFKSLRLLSLSDLPIDEGVIEYFIRGSPLLEEIYLRYCRGFKKFCVKTHQNLLKVEIYCATKVEIVDVEAPNLSYFLFASVISKENAPSMFIGSCKKLTTFCYRGCPFNGFNEFLSNFPLLKNVALDLPSRVTNLKLSNNSLRKIRLQRDCDLDEVHLNAPNLLLFDYCSQINFSYLAPLSREDSSLSKGCMKCEIAHHVDSFQKLRRFLDKNGIFKVLKLVIYRDVIDVEKLKAIESPPCELEHVELRQTFDLLNVSVSATVLDALLWCCRPQSLTLTVIRFSGTNDVVKYAYEKLLQQEEGQTNINFVLVSSFKDKQHFSDLNSLLKALSLDQISYKITFIKE